MHLTEAPTTVIWPPTHYAFVEKAGPFQVNAPQAWHELHAHRPLIAEHNQITGYMSLYQVEPPIYRAGLALSAAPQQLPEGVSYVEFNGGTYARFILTGSYANLPQASGRVMEIITSSKLPLRHDFFIENYVNNPSSTPEEELITEILVPRQG